MYKDKDKQREANRQAQARFKAKQSLVERGITKKVLPLEPKSVLVIPKHSYIGTVPEVPGVTVVGPKRGKDIKTFEDLSPDVQQTIDMMSMVEGKIDQTIKANRTAIAVNYQHLFPDRYNSTGVG